MPSPAVALHARSVLAVIAVGSAVTGCTALPTTATTPGAASGEDASASRLELDDVSRLHDALDCLRSDVLLDDLNFFDAMRGIDCYVTADEAILVRAYERESSVDQTLVDWLPVLSRAQQVIVGANWFAIGTPGRLTTLAERLGLNTRPTPTPAIRPQQLTPDQERIGSCSTTVSQLVQQLIDEASAPSTDLADAERVLPGITTVVERLAGRLTDSSTSDPTNVPLNIRLSSLGPEIKAACAVGFTRPGTESPTPGDPPSGG